MTFAGVPGSSKSIIAHYLSENFGLAILSTDNIRFEVREDMRSADLNEPPILKEYEDRVRKRRQAMYARRRPFILDGSMDRSWSDIRRELIVAEYTKFLIDIELSRPFLEELYSTTARPNSIGQLDHYLPQHEAFMHDYGAEVDLRITDETFARRTEIAAEALRAFLGDKAVEFR